MIDCATSRSSSLAIGGPIKFSPLITYDINVSEPRHGGRIHPCIPRHIHHARSMFASAMYHWWCSFGPQGSAPASLFVFGLRNPELVRYSDDSTAEGCLGSISQSLSKGGHVVASRLSKTTHLPMAEQCAGCAGPLWLDRVLPSHIFACRLPLHIRTKSGSNRDTDWYGDLAVARLDESLPEPYYGPKHDHHPFNAGRSNGRSALLMRSVASSPSTRPRRGVDSRDGRCCEQLQRCHVAAGSSQVFLRVEKAAAIHAGVRVHRQGCEQLTNGLLLSCTATIRCTSSSHLILTGACAPAPPGMNTAWSCGTVAFIPTFMRT
ncbi:hypothetical protein B0I35DRAFT_64450 [Stachybotrys elegans]|uniref:Uncharacterized protein n=1 Tax=Stachybotrys elegans TaxID=80388 RepID=A0A8K0SGB5_9HYPO|nr:hypothetical protein B0I35DRAFT_64450 [Stachybotrys elegans]